MNPTQRVVGTRLRLFSRRVFGSWVSGRVISATTRSVMIQCSYWNSTWKERWPIDTEFYYPAGHPRVGEAFRLTETTNGK